MDNSNNVKVKHGGSAPHNRRWWWWRTAALWLHCALERSPPFTAELENVFTFMVGRSKGESVALK